MAEYMLVCLSASQTDYIGPGESAKKRNSSSVSGTVMAITGLVLRSGISSGGTSLGYSSQSQFVVSGTGLNMEPSTDHFKC